MLFELAFIGLLTGSLASMIGGGTEIIMVPLLLYFNIVDDYKRAVGTSLAALLLPIGSVAVYFYAKHNYVEWKKSLILSLFFIIGTSVASYSIHIDPKILKTVFSVCIIMFGIYMLTEEFTN